MCIVAIQQTGAEWAPSVKGYINHNSSGSSTFLAIFDSHCQTDWVQFLLVLKIKRVVEKAIQYGEMEIGTVVAYFKL